MLRFRELRTVLRAAVDLGKPDLIRLVCEARAAQVARRRAHMRDVLFRIQADKATRHQEIRELMAEIAEDRAIRQEEIAHIGAEANELMARYRAENKEVREEWQRQLARIAQVTQEPGSGRLPHPDLGGRSPIQ